MCHYSHGISTPTNINTQFLLQSLNDCVRACVRACVCVCCVCVRAYVHACVFPYIIPYVNCFGRIVLYMCTEYCIYVNIHVSYERSGCS